MYLIANPIVRYLLIAVVPVLFMAAWFCFRAHVSGVGPGKLIAKWRERRHRFGQPD